MRYTLEGEKISFRCTYLALTRADAEALYARLRTAFPGLRSFSCPYDRNQGAAIAREMETIYPGPEDYGMAQIFHYWPPPGWSFSADGVLEGRLVSSLSLPPRYFRTLIAHTFRTDYSRVPEHALRQAGRDPARLAELRRKFGFDMQSEQIGSNSVVESYFRIGDDEQRLFVQKVMSTARRGLTNRFRWQDMITGEPLFERSGEMLWSGEDTVHQCRERADFFIYTHWSEENQRWIGVKALPREPRRRRNAHTAPGPA